MSSKDVWFFTYVMALATGNRSTVEHLWPQTELKHDR